MNEQCFTKLKSVKDFHPVQIYLAGQICQTFLSSKLHHGKLAKVSSHQTFLLCGTRKVVLMVGATFYDFMINGMQKEIFVSCLVFTLENENLKGSRAGQACLKDCLTVNFHKYSYHFYLTVAFSSNKKKNLENWRPFQKSQILLEHFT